MLRRLLSVGMAVCAASACCADIPWRNVLDQPAGWYATGDAVRIARSVLEYQTPEGGWPKNVDMSRPPSAEFLANTKFDHRAPTIDNDATTTQLQLLARVISETDNDGMQSAFFRGFDYLLAAQYENGGWPQYFPLIKGYYTHITFNDDAMINVLELLRDAAAGAPPFKFVDEPRRARAKSAISRGIACILRCQVREHGALTVWCAQHDENTFAPAWARNFEPPSLSGAESARIVEFLLTVPNAGAEIDAAIEGAVAWLANNAFRGIRVENFVGDDGSKDRRAVEDSSAPAIWARFYELETSRPIFTGRDRIIRYDFNQIERERRTGYNYFGPWPAKLLNDLYPRWRSVRKMSGS